MCYYELYEFLIISFIYFFPSKESLYKLVSLASIFLRKDLREKIHKEACLKKLRKRPHESLCSHVRKRPYETICL